MALGALGLPQRGLRHLVTLDGHVSTWGIQILNCNQNINSNHLNSNSAAQDDVRKLHTSQKTATFNPTPEVHHVGGGGAAHEVLAPLRPGNSHWMDACRSWPASAHFEFLV